MKINNIFSIVENDFGGTVINSEGHNITNRIMASGYLGRALNLGHLGLIYDKAYIIRPETEEIIFSPWDEVIDAAIEDLRLYYLIGRHVAFGDAWPEWYEGNEFRAIREASQATE